MPPTIQHRNIVTNYDDYYLLLFLLLSCMRVKVPDPMVSTSFNFMYLYFLFLFPHMCFFLLRIWWRVHTALKDSDEVLTKRARHVVTEIQRTLEAAETLKRRDFKKVSACYVSKTSICTYFQRVKLNCYCAKSMCLCEGEGERCCVAPAAESLLGE